MLGYVKIEISPQRGSESLLEASVYMNTTL
nr:MAG TPA: hypothetical protein [Caudoviricetes sp.]DAY27396.1 MAG TPA: hypothetical protein [Caudoviricetes sp.]